MKFFRLCLVFTAAMGLFSKALSAEPEDLLAPLPSKRIVQKSQTQARAKTLQATAAGRPIRRYVAGRSRADRAGGQHVVRQVRMPRAAMAVQPSRHIQSDQVFIRPGKEVRLAHIQQAVPRPVGALSVQVLAFADTAVAEGTRLIRQKQFEAAIAVLKKAIVAAPTHDGVNFLLGKAHYHIMDHSQALRYLKLVPRPSIYYAEAQDLQYKILEGNRRFRRMNNQITVALNTIEEAYVNSGWQSLEMPGAELNAIFDNVSREIVKTQNLNPIQREYNVKLVRQSLNNGAFLLTENAVLVSLPLISYDLHFRRVTDALFQEMQRRVKSNIQAIVVQWFNSDHQFLEIYFYRDSQRQPFQERLWVLNGREMTPSTRSANQMALVKQFLNQTYQ